MQLKGKRLLIGGLFLLVVGGLILTVGSIFFFAFSPARPGTEVSHIIEVHKGTGPSELSKMLVQTGVINDADSFIWLGRLTRQWKSIKAGEYKVSGAQTPLQIFQIITSGISVTRPQTIREGENMYEVSQSLASSGLDSQGRFLKLCKDPQFLSSLGFQGDIPKTLEGYLFPDTYFFNRSTPAEEMIRTMVKRFHSVWTPAEEARARELGMTRHQIVTLASMIEKETGAPNERPLISSVFHNRLKKRMRLQSDPTTIYGIWERYSGNLKKTDLLEYTPYNTYAIPALPAGPISSPGKESLQAALFPDTSEYLFFVSHNDGTHEFTRNFGEHNKAVQKFQMDRKARNGKSWRDLNKKDLEH